MRIRNADPPPNRKQILKESRKDAADNVEQEIREAIADEQSRDEIDIPADVIAKFGDAKSSLKKSADDLGAKARKTAKNANDAIKDTVQDTKEQAIKRDGKDEGQGKEEAKTWSDVKSSLKKSADDLGAKARETVKNANNAFKDTVQDTKEQAIKRDGKDEGQGKEEAKTWNDESKNWETRKQDENVNDEDEQEQSWMAGEREEIEANGLDSSAMSYEVNMDEVKNEAEQKAEEELQPNGGS